MEENKDNIKIKNGILICYYNEEFFQKAKDLEKILKFPFFYKECEENKVLVIKNGKVKI